MKRRNNSMRTYSMNRQPQVLGPDSGRVECRHQSPEACRLAQRFQRRIRAKPVGMAEAAVYDPFQSVERRVDVSQRGVSCDPIVKHRVPGAFMRRNAAAGLLMPVVEREKDAQRTFRTRTGSAGSELETQPRKANHCGGARFLGFAQHGPGCCGQKQGPIVVRPKISGAFGHPGGQGQGAEGKERPRIVVVGLKVQRIAHYRVVEGGTRIGAAAKSGKDYAP